MMTDEVYKCNYINIDDHEDITMAIQKTIELQYHENGVVLGRRTSRVKNKKFHNKVKINQVLIQSITKLKLEIDYEAVIYPSFNKDIQPKQCSIAERIEKDDVYLHSYKLRKYNYSNLIKKIQTYNVETIEENEFWKNILENKPILAINIFETLFDNEEEIWNLAKLNTILSDYPFTIKGVTTPCVYIGSSGSIVPLNKATGNLFTLAYLHSGCSRIWYVIPPAYCNTLSEYLNRQIRHRSCDDPISHENHIPSLTLLNKLNIPYVKVRQEAGEYIILYPLTYYFGYNEGYNECEIVNFATQDWIQYGLDIPFCKCKGSTGKIDMDFFKSKYREYKSVSIYKKGMLPFALTEFVKWELDLAADSHRKFEIARLCNWKYAETLYKNSLTPSSLASLSKELDNVLILARTKQMVPQYTGPMFSMLNIQYNEALVVHFETDIIDKFLKSSLENSNYGIETMAILMGKLSNGHAIIDEMVIPKQEGTSESCYTTDTGHSELESYIKQRSNNFVFGWIHSHINHELYLSGTDLHTLCYMQTKNPSAFAIVHIPKRAKSNTPIGFNWDIYRLTGDGFKEIRHCTRNSAACADNHAHEGGVTFYKRMEKDIDYIFNDDITVTVTDLRDVISISK